MMGSLNKTWISQVLAPCVGVLFILATWEIASLFIGRGGSTMLPPPATVLKEFGHLLANQATYRNLADTGLRVGLGFFFAFLIGVPVGILMGLNDLAYRAMSPVFDFIRSVPISSLYPVFVLAAGIGAQSKIAMVAAATTPVFVLQAAFGAAAQRPVRRQAIRLMGAKSVQQFLMVVLPGAAPQIAVGVRIALSYALIVAVLTEMFMGSEFGLGQRIMETYTTFNVSEMYGWILLTGTFGYLLHLCAQALERRLFNWT